MCNGFRLNFSVNFNIELLDFVYMTWISRKDYRKFLKSDSEKPKTDVIHADLYPSNTKRYLTVSSLDCSQLVTGKSWKNWR